MSFKSAIASATALTLLAASGAWADNNAAWLVQDGNHNTAQVNQNLAGSGQGNQVGNAANAALQDGERNNARITQGGADNRVGTVLDNGGQGGFLQVGNDNSAAVTQQGAGGHHLNFATQSGNQNMLTVQQANSGNAISTVSQTVSVAVGASGANIATLTQDGVGNRIGDGRANPLAISRGITQGYGVANALANQISVTQTGNYNQVVAIRQRGGNQSVTIDILGNQNVITHADHNERSNGQGNRITLSITGDRNGAGANYSGASANYTRTGAFRLGSAADSVSDGVSWFGQGGAIQGANNNTLNHTITGDANLFAFRQYGSRNSVISTSDGNGNQVAVRQEHNDNISAILQQGHRNDIGITVPTGDGNIADATQIGDDNSVRIVLQGNGNGSSLFGATVAGDLVQQSFPATVRNGDALQQGNLNVLNFGAVGDNNRFAFAQIGNSNTITGTVSGSSNQAAVLQSGSHNTSVFSQAGGNNIVAISQ